VDGVLHNISFIGVKTDRPPLTDTTATSSAAGRQPPATLTRKSGKKLLAIPLTPKSASVKNAERRTPNAERRTPNAERRTPNAER
jgi:hypothetical protein